MSNPPASSETPNGLPAVPIFDDHTALAANYNSIECRFGWDFLLGGNRHFGYYDTDTYWPLPFSRAQRRMEERLLGTLSLPPNSRLLDAGCGDGYVAMFMARHGGMRVTAFDVIERHVDNARKNVADANLNSLIAVTRLDFAHLDTLPPASHDGVYTSEALLHAADPGAVVAGFLRILRPGGRLVMHEFHHDFADQAMVPGYTREINNTVPPKDPATGAPRQEAFYRVETYFTKILEQAGYTDIVVQNYSDRMQPMLRFMSIFGVTRHIVRFFRLERWFPNAAATTEGYVGQEHWAYASISATRPVEGA
ncbi:S-adenosyl-L-methionine-dependent methyltransferase [Bombardia bombarda]|uniref:S-adenosyl-L-methionine-dependent methyltransferase n=1 Tax=Bombardia bombarda TaxID=252184 RepID=A0AA39U331_9PEZI|nr:S-adenosyl-L-methionine-dependent methyltransferase [Bombardia bombarda]